MKVILKQDIKGIGRKYEVKDISDGYANNFLLPKKLAEYASADVVKKYEALRKAQEIEEGRNAAAAHEYLKTLKEVTVVLKRKTNEKGHLFEKVHADDVVAAIKEATGIPLSSSSLSFPKPIKEVGIHTVDITLGKQSGVTNVEVVGL